MVNNQGASVLETIIKFSTSGEGKVQTITKEIKNQFGDLIKTEKTVTDNTIENQRKITKTVNNVEKDKIRAAKEVMSNIEKEAIIEKNIYKQKEKTWMDSATTQNNIRKQKEKNLMDEAKRELNILRQKEKTHQEAYKKRLNILGTLQGAAMQTGFTLLFGGMAIARFFGGLTNAMFNTYQLAIGQTGEFNLQTNRLAGAWEFFKYSLMDAMVQSGFLTFLVETVISTVDWFNNLSQSTKTWIGISIIGILLISTGFMILGQIMLGVSWGIGLAKTAMVLFGASAAPALWTTSAAATGVSVSMAPILITAGLIVLSIIAIISIIYVVILICLNWKETWQQIKLSAQGLWENLVWGAKTIVYYIEVLLLKAQLWITGMKGILPVINMIGEGMIWVVNLVIKMINAWRDWQREKGNSVKANIEEVKWVKITEEDQAAVEADLQAKLDLLAAERNIASVLHDKEDALREYQIAELELNKEGKTKEFWDNLINGVPTVPETTTSNKNESTIINDNSNTTFTIVQQPGETNDDLVKRVEEWYNNKQMQLFVENGSPRAA